MNVLMRGAGRLTCSAVHRPSILRPTPKLLCRSVTNDSLNIQHSQFIAEANKKTQWSRDGGVDNPEDKAEAQVVGPAPKGSKVPSIGTGSISSTSSHLFKLTISPPTPPTEDPGTKPPPPTVFLLHPSQPLSHAARLITTCVPPPPPRVSFRSAPGTPDEIQWSDSTDVGDFVKEAANQKEFSIVLTHDEDASSEKGQNNESEIVVTVPSFHERTKYSRLKLHRLKGELRQMDSLKRECDHEAHRGARRVALTGFGMLVVYWGGVARLTFWDLGWEIMEPVTYLSGLSTVICGYLWFLYQGREVSYSSVLSQSISTRRAALYKKRGLDLDKLIDLLAEEKAIRREVSKIAEDYGVKWEWSNSTEEPEDDEDVIKAGKNAQKKEDGEKLKKADKALDEKL